MRIIKNIAKYAAITFVLLICGELMLYAHSYLRFDSEMVYLPNSRSGCMPDTKYLPGISGTSYFTTNSIGLRGPEPEDGGLFGVAIGNSTTKNSWLDDNETWPQIVMDVYNKDCNKPVVINTAAHGGLTPRHMVLITENLIKSPNKPNFILWMADLGSLGMLLKQSPNYAGLDVGDEKKAFMTGIYRPWHLPREKEQTLLHQYYEKTEKRISEGFDSVFGTVADSEQNGKKLEKERQFRRECGLATWEQMPPSILESKPAALADFRRHAVEVVNLCHSNNIKLFLITQPINYKPHMTEKEADLYPAVVFEDKLISPEIYNEMLIWFIEEIEDIATDYDVSLIPLYSHFLKLDDCFIDSCHFNEKGSMAAAEIITNYLKNNGRLF